MLPEHSETPEAEMACIHSGCQAEALEAENARLRSMISPERGVPLPPVTARDRESYAFGASDHYGDTQIIVQPGSYTDDDWYWYLRGVVEHPVWARGLYLGPLDRPYRCSCDQEEVST